MAAAFLQSRSTSRHSVSARRVNSCSRVCCSSGFAAERALVFTNTAFTCSLDACTQVNNLALALQMPVLCEAGGFREPGLRLNSRMDALHISTELKGAR
jgi:hypothetical protein